MLSVKVYVIGCTAILGVWLMQYSYWFTLLSVGALTCAASEYLKERKAARMQAFLDEIEMQKMEAEAQTAQARADLETEAVHRARAQRGLIPQGYIGAQLYRPEHANLYHVWGEVEQKISVPVRVQEETTPALPAPEQGLPTAASFVEALGVLSEAKGRVLLGYDTEGPIWLGVDELLSVALAGNSGRGKSKALLWLSAQLIKLGITTIFLDGKGDLRRWLSAYHAVAYSGAEIKQSTDAVLSEAEWRLKMASDDPDATFKPILVVIDELDLVLGRYARVLELIEMLTKKTRSVNVHGIYSNQSIPADLVGGVATRGVIVSRICLYCDDEAARLIGVRANNGAAALLQQLAPPAPAGLAVARTVAFGWRQIAFPYVPEGSVRWLLDGMPPLEALPMRQNPVSVRPDQQAENSQAAENEAPVITHTQKITKAQRVEIWRLHDLGEKPSVIAGAVLGDNHKGFVVRQVLKEGRPNE